MNYHELIEKNMKKRKKRKSMIITVVVMLIPALLLLLYQPFNFYLKDPHIIKEAQAIAQENYDETTVDNNEQWLESIWKQTSKNSNGDLIETKEMADNNLTYDWSQVKFISSIPSNASVNKSLYRGQLFIPELNMNLPIVEGVSNENLYTGASTMKPNMVLGKGNYSVAGHLMPDPNTLFSPLKRAEKGMYIYATDKKDVYIYEIEQIEYVDPSQIEWIEDEEDKTLITLVTCGTLDGVNRLIVQGNFIKSQSIDSFEQELADSYIH